MKHLTRGELVESADGTLAAARAAHLDVCERCRREAEQVGAMLAEVRRLGVPEPSPLFWEYFSARVRERVAAEPPPRAAALWTWRAAALGSAAAAILLAVALGIVWRVGRGTESVERAVTPGSPHTVVADPAVVVPPAPEVGWDLLAAVMDDLSWDEVQETAGLAIRPGTAERAVAMLDEAERARLVELLKAEVAPQVGPVR